MLILIQIFNANFANPFSIAKVKSFTFCGGNISWWLMLPQNVFVLCVSKQASAWDESPGSSLSAVKMSCRCLSEPTAVIEQPAVHCTAPASGFCFSIAACVCGAWSVRLPGLWFVFFHEFGKIPSYHFPKYAFFPLFSCPFGALGYAC